MKKLHHWQDNILICYVFCVFREKLKKAAEMLLVIAISLVTLQSQVSSKPALSAKPEVFENVQEIKQHRRYNSSLWYSSPDVPATGGFISKVPPE